MIVSHAKRFIFLKPRKTAGTSVEIALSRHCGPRDIITPVWTPDEELRRAAGGRGPQNHESPPLPQPVRSHTPAGRARTLVDPIAWRSYEKISMVRDPWDTVASLYFWRNPARYQDWSFERFVADEAVATLAKRNEQTFRIRGRIVADRIIRFERLTEDVADTWIALGLDEEPTLPRAKSQFRPEKVDPRTLYDDETRDRVAELFAVTIDDFGYSF